MKNLSYDLILSLYIVLATIAVLLGALGATWGSDDEKIKGKITLAAGIALWILFLLKNMFN